MKEKKPVKLKLWLIIATDGNGNRPKDLVFVLATCGMKAREAYLNKFKTHDIIQVLQTAESEKDSEWLKENSPFQILRRD